MRNHSSNMMKQFALTVVGQVLETSSVLTHAKENMRRATIASVCCGIMLAATLLVGCYGFYLWLIQQGFMFYSALSIVGGVLLLLTVTTGLVAKYSFTNATSPTENHSLFSGNENSGNMIEDVATAFLSGLLAPEEDNTDKSESSDSQDTEETASLELVKQ